METKNPTETQKLNKFKEWVIEVGGDFSKLGVADFEKEGRGAIALQDFVEDENLCSIPLSCLITQQTAINSTVGKAVEALKLEMPDEWTLLYLFVLHEKLVNPASFWKPYLDILPNRTETPLSYSEDLMNELKGTNLYEAVIELKAKLKKNYENVVEKLTEMRKDLFPADAFTWDNFLSIYEVIWGRLITVLLDGNKVAALAPVIDLLNHSHRQKVSYFTDVKENKFCLKTHSPVKKGEQVFNNFGPRSNEKLLLIYGFALEDNFADSLLLKIGAAGDVLFPQKLNLLKKLGLTIEHYLVRNQEEFIPSSLFDSLRICLLTEEQLYFFDESTYKSGIICESNEVLMLHTLKRLLNSKKSRFSTSIQQDKERLKTVKLGSSLYFCLLYVIGQKEILDYSLDYLERVERSHLKKFQPILNLNETYVPLQDSSDGEVIVFEKWLFSQCASPNFQHMKVKGGLKNEQIGMISSQDLPPFSSFIEIPFSLLISNETIDKSKLSSQNGIINLTKRLLFILFIALEIEDKDSMYAPFFRALKSPSFNLHSIPLFYDPDILSIIEPTHVGSEVLNFLETAQEDLGIVLSSCPQLETRLSQANFLLAVYIYESRSITIFRKGKQEIVVVPLLCFTQTPSSIWHFYHNFDLPKDVLQLNNFAPQPKGRIITESIGKTCHDLLWNDGLAQPELQPDDTFPIEIEVPESEITQKGTFDQLEELPSLKHFLKLNQYPLKLIQTLRFLSSVITEEDDEDYASSWCRQILENLIAPVEENSDKPALIYLLHQQQILHSVLGILPYFDEEKQDETPITQI